MDDLISRQAAIDALWGIQRELQMIDASEGADITIHGIQLALHKIEQLPTAEPRKGKWIYGEDDGQDGWFCSECGRFIPWDYDYYGLDNIDFITDYKTCPFCDAKMITYTGAKMEET